MKPAIKYIDIHGHISDHEYDSDRDDAIARATSLGVGMIAIGTDLESSQGAVALAEKYENVWATVGMHPTDSMSGHKVNSTSADNQFDYGAFKKLAEHFKVVAIGECGLDYFKPVGAVALTADEILIQHEIFLKHVELANEVNKPLMLHVRNGAVGTKYGTGTSTDNGGPNTDTFFVSAYQEVVAILKEKSKVPANFHFFAGDIDDAKAILDIGGMISVTGVITFARNYDDVIKYVPIDRMMSETDSPFVAPKPYRGKRNEPAFVVEVVKSIAKILEDDEKAVSEQLLANAIKFFNLK